MPTLRNPVVLRTLSWVVCAASIVAAFALWPAQIYLHGTWLDYVTDDAFYYLVIARNLARHGLSSFDCTTLTNGYQPLWQGVLALQELLWPNSFNASVFIEAAAVCMAALLTMGLIRPENFGVLPVFSALLLGLIHYPFVTDGMETSVLLLVFVVFVFALRRSAADALSWVPIAVAGSAVIAARLDAAFFVLPALIVVPRARRQSILALCVLGACGLVYATANQLIFGSWLPISGSIKSLGGIQINHALLQQIAENWDSRSSLIRDLIDLSRWPVATTVCLFVLTGILLSAAPRLQNFPQRFALAMILGFILYALRLSCLSSWRVWEWYCFPAFFFLIALFLLLEDVLCASSTGLLLRFTGVVVICALIGMSTIFRGRDSAIALVVLLAVALASKGSMPKYAYARTAVGLLGAYLLTVCTWSHMAVPPAPATTFGPMGRILAQKVQDKIGAVPIAMGDRAGAFAYYFDGQVHQLEGIVNDVEYLTLLKAKSPIGPLLCRRGVRYLLAWEPDLGDYRTHSYRVFRPVLTTFVGPQITVSSADQVAEFNDAHSLGMIMQDEDVYLWRLGACNASRS